MIKYSIIIPVYNTKKEQLETCIDSCLKQDYKNFEIIIVNDGSNTECSNQLKIISKSDKKLILVEKENGGVSSARNTGIKKATAEYILFLDADDILHPTTLSQIDLFLEKTKSDLIIWNYSFFVEKPNFTTIENKALDLIPHQHYTQNEICNKVLDLKQGFDVIRCKLYKSEIIKKNNLFFNEELTQGEDIIFNMDYFSHIKSADHYFIDLYFYRKDFSSASQSYNKNYSEKIKLFIIELLKRNNDSSQNNFYSIENIDTRIIHAIFAVVLHYFFHPQNPNTTKENKKEFIQYLSDKEISKTIQKVSYKNFSIQRKIPLFFLKHKSYLGSKIVSVFRWMFLKKKFKD